MEKNDIFRVAMFGGYNKEDVQEYIKTLENEIETIKLLHIKEKEDLIRRLESGEGEDASVEEKEKLRKELDASREELSTLKQELTQKNEQIHEFLRADEKAASEKKEESTGEEEEQIRHQMEELNRQYEALERQKESLEETARENDRLHREILNVRQENLRLHDTCKELNKQVAEKEEELQEGLGDRKLIAEILEDARRNAEMIREDAQKEGQMIIENACAEAEKQKAEIVKRINAELEDKGIQLIAAKHKLNRYMKEVKMLQEALYNLYSRMHVMVENMPVRLDQYWDGENYKILENDLKSGKTSSETENDAETENKEE